MSELMFTVITIWSMLGLLLAMEWYNHFDVQPIWKTIIVILLSGPFMWLFTLLLLAVVIPIGIIGWTWKKFLEI